MKLTDKEIKDILELIPKSVSYFEGSEYPLPIKTTIFGKDKLNLDNLNKELIEKKDKDIKEILELLLIAAELFEASQKDNTKYFITDKNLRELVFMGSKWRAGWVLVLGGNDQKELIYKLKEKEFIVFTDIPGIEETYYIGNRNTSPIYFLQMMVRYGLMWGRIKPGDSHHMGHFLEKDMPGFIIIYKDLTPLKYLITLGIMKMGAPAIVPSSFPFPYGNRIVANDINDIINRRLTFPNLRLKYYKEEIIILPEYCNIAYVNEKLKKVKVWGKDTDSFFLLKSANNIKRSINIIGKLEDQIGVIVEIEDKNLSYDMEEIIEKQALRSINYIYGIKAFEDKGVFTIKSIPENDLDSKKIAEAIYWGIRMRFPRLKKIKIDIIFDKEILAKESKNARKRKKVREQFIKKMSEETVEEFCACTECRPFSLEHTCILTPDHAPMCASRTYFTVKADYLFGNTVIPYKRREDEELPLKLVFKKGRVINSSKGEYEGCNDIYKTLTIGKLKKVYLHSLKEFPRTSCGCFQNIAFWIKEVNGIGIMSRNSEAIAPNGMTWDNLANSAGGKQISGIMGISTNYIRSTNFLKGDGGIGNVVWVDSKLYSKISKHFLYNQRVSTEKEVNSISRLKEFLKKND